MVEPWLWLNHSIRPWFDHDIFYQKYHIAKYLVFSVKLTVCVTCAYNFWLDAFDVRRRLVDITGQEEEGAKELQEARRGVDSANRPRRGPERLL